MASALAIAGLVVASLILFVLSTWFFGWLWRYTSRQYPKTVVLTGESHLPGLNFCGPGTQYEKRQKENHEPVNPLDECCQHHDESYGQASGWEDVRKADQELVQCARKASLKTREEEIDARMVVEGLTAKIGLENVGLLSKGSFANVKKKNK